MTNTSFYGQDGIPDSNSDFHMISFLVRQELAKVQVAVPVKVVAVHGGGLSGLPTVDVLPLVNQIDGVGNSTQHSTVFGVRCKRAQGGNYAVINDPKVGDLGSITVCARDISSVVTNTGQANPGSRRRFSMADSFYEPSVWSASGEPTQYIQFTDTGISIHDLNGNTITTSSAGINLNGVVIDNTGKITSPADIIGNSISLDNHVHGGVQPGSGNTGTPTG